MLWSVSSRDDCAGYNRAAAALLQQGGSGAFQQGSDRVCARERRLFSTFPESTQTRQLSGYTTLHDGWYLVLINPHHRLLLCCVYRWSNCYCAVCIVGHTYS